MNAFFRQSDRLGHLSTVLGNDALVLLRFDGTDYLNNLFEYRIEALAATSEIDFDDLIGTHATVTLEGRNGPRPFDGIVTKARWAGAGENGHRYEMTLRPWFWLCGQRVNQRIFHHKTVEDILNELFADYAELGNPAVEFRLSEDYPLLEYTVQYRETDLNFARRQMERHGISFYFEHQNGNHVMVLSDDPRNHETIGAVPFKSYVGDHQAETEHFWEWSPERNLATGSVRLIDYNFKKPAASMEAESQGDAAHAFGQLESYEYPGDYDDLGSGNNVAQRRLKQFRGADRRNRAVGDCMSLGAGKLFNLNGDLVPGTGQNYMCLEATHSFKSEAYGTTRDAISDDFSYVGNYVFMPETAPLAPPRNTSSPVVEGPQTGVVVGDDEIDCDEFGRVLVRFHWDLAGAISMRCRVRQNWAGNGLGEMIIPRVGMEVLVDFIDGSPDKPIVTGCVVNAMNRPIYPLPGEKTKTGLKTKTHHGSGYNELSFEDAKGREEIFLHAEKDLNRVIRDNESTLLEGGNRTVTVETGTETKTIKGDRTITVQEGDETTTIEKGNRTLTVKEGTETKTIHGDRTITVQEGDETTTIGSGDRTVIVKTGDETKTISSGNLTNNVAQTISMSANKITHTATRGKIAPGIIELNATDDIQMNSKNTYSLSGTNSFAVDSKDVSVTGGNCASMKVGDSEITLEPGRITIKCGGSTITLTPGDIDANASGKINMKAGEIHLND